MSGLTCERPSKPCTDPHDNSTYCLNGGLCCQNYREKFCRCPYSQDRSLGERCRNTPTAHAEETPLLLNVVAMTSVLIIIIVIVLVVLIGYIVVRARRRRMNCSCCGLRTESPEDLESNEKKTKPKISRRIQPGFSWRETTHRQQRPRTLTHSLDDVNEEIARQRSPMTSPLPCQQQTCDIMSVAVQLVVVPPSSGSASPNSSVEDERGQLLGHF